MPNDSETLPEGSYAVRRFDVTEKMGFAKHWDDLVSDIVTSDLMLAERPCFEIYHRYDVDNWRSRFKYLCCC